MAKCIFCEKAYLKGYRRCKITGQIKGYKCYDDTLRKPCKYFTMNLFNRILYWFGDRFY